MPQSPAAVGTAPPPPRNIGPYELDQLLGRGGMAEVYRARRVGPGGFEKVLALKRILPSYARDPRLVGRFLDEARICARLDHSNIVHVVDFGSADGEYYLVMEWVDGANLFSVLRGLAERGQRLPMEVTAYVIAEAAAGLDEAHGLRDEGGRPLGLVHRDISPQNVLLSKKGDVKISDFGIAKAIGSSVKTMAGVQIGKLCYMSPEQARQETLDARADIYSLGVVLWECLAGRPLFPRTLDAEALSAVMHPEVAPPSTWGPVPAALEDATMRALSPHRDNRTATADALGRQLRVYLHSVAPGYGQRDLARYLGERWAAPEPPSPAAELAALSTVSFAAPSSPDVAPPATSAPPTTPEIPGVRRSSPSGVPGRSTPPPGGAIEMPRLPVQPALGVEAAKARISSTPPAPPRAGPVPSMPATRAGGVPVAAEASGALRREDPGGAGVRAPLAARSPSSKRRWWAGCLLAIVAFLFLCAMGLGYCAWRIGFLTIPALDEPSPSSVAPTPP